MPGDVDESSLSGHVRAQVAARSLLERALVGAVDEHHVQVQTWNDDPSNRLALVGRQPVSPCLQGDRATNHGE